MYSFIQHAFPESLSGPTPVLTMSTVGTKTPVSALVRLPEKCSGGRKASTGRRRRLPGPGPWLGTGTPERGKSGGDTEAIWGLSWSLQCPHCPVNTTPHHRRVPQCLVQKKNQCIHLSTHSFSKYLLGISRGPGPVLGAGDSAMFETDQVPTLTELIILAGETESKQ